jgi:hypothetical protein
LNSLKLFIVVSFTFFSCSELKKEPIVVLYKDSTFDKALNDSILVNIEKGLIGKKPLVVINGEIYALPNTQDTIILPITKYFEPITTILKKDIAKEIYPNEGFEGILLFNFN